MTTTAHTAEQIIALGGARWTKAGKDRVYINNWAPFYGLEITRYNTGNISHATEDGERISNSRAGRLLGAVRSVYLDVTTGHIVVETSDRDMADYLRDSIAKAVAALTPAAPTDVIAALRAAGRTAREIAAAVGVHVSTVYRWARGIFRPTAARAAALAALTA